MRMTFLALLVKQRNDHATVPIYHCDQRCWCRRVSFPDSKNRRLLFLFVNQVSSRVRTLQEKREREVDGGVVFDKMR